MDGRYVTWAQFTLKYKKAADRGGSDVIIPSYVMTAEDEVDASVGKIYTVPFASNAIPGIIKDIVMDLAWYKMIWEQENAPALKKYVDARLTSIMKGGTILTVNGATLNMNPGAVLSDRNYPNTFGVDNQRLQYVDPDWIDAEQSGRAGPWNQNGNPNGDQS